MENELETSPGHASSLDVCSCWMIGQTRERMICIDSNMAATPLQCLAVRLRFRLTQASQGQPNHHPPRPCNLYQIFVSRRFKFDSHSMPRPQKTTRTGDISWHGRNLKALSPWPCLCLASPNIGFQFMTKHVTCAYISDISVPKKGANTSKT